VESSLETGQVLIISSHSLFAEAITQVLYEQGVGRVVKVEHVANATLWLREQDIGTIIVDQDDPQLRHAELVSQLLGYDETRQVIFLSLTGNQMIVHHRERVENVTPNDLIKALHPSRANCI
jgi:DNA-binding NarL/FixJ family response regulator